MSAFIGLKAFVAGPLSPWSNPTAQPSAIWGYWRAWGRERSEELLG